MDGATISRFPFFSWLRFRVTGSAKCAPLVFHLHSVAHVISLTAAGRHSVRCITRGREVRWDEKQGAVNYTPRDDEHHVFVTAMSTDFESQVVMIPDGHLRACVASEAMSSQIDFRQIGTRSDPVLRSCMERLTAAVRTDQDTSGLREDEASRRLVLRLVELSGGGKADWHLDDSIFDSRTLANVVDYIDNHLKITPSLADLAVLVGLSPSHFAKKFRHSTGLSPHRFINRQRILRAINLLKTDERPLAIIALELGFSSQSHFTRLFSELSGMTPARYRKECGAYAE